MMEFIASHLDVVIWSVLAVVFFVLEMGTVATVSIWFVGGCVAALIVALIGGPIWLQVILALGVSGGLLAGFRKMLVGRGPKKPLPEKITDGMEGRIAVVSTAIEPGGKGQVSLDGIEWTAMAMDENESLPVKTRVVICRQEGCCCIVEKYDLN